MKINLKIKNKMLGSENELLRSKKLFISPILSVFRLFWERTESEMELERLHSEHNGQNGETKAKF